MGISFYSSCLSHFIPLVLGFGLALSFATSAATCYPIVVLLLGYARITEKFSLTCSGQFSCYNVSGVTVIPLTFQLKYCMISTQRSYCAQFQSQKAATVWIGVNRIFRFFSFSLLIRIEKLKNKMPLRTFCISFKKEMNSINGSLRFI